MAARRPLDAAGRAGAVAELKRWLILLLLIAAVLAAAAQTVPANQSSQAEHLLAQQHWPELVALLAPVPARSADQQYDYALALAQLGRWDEARTAFLAGCRMWPADARFPVELAGVEFKQKHYPQAAAWLRRGLRLNPNDTYANDFLGSVYFL